jgi:hypothetical protein
MLVFSGGFISYVSQSSRMESAESVSIVEVRP